MCLSILILRAWIPVLTCRTISTCRESNGDQRGIYKQSSGLRTRADSDLTLKEQIAKLDDMVLQDGNEAESDKTNEE